MQNKENEFNTVLQNIFNCSPSNENQMDYNQIQKKEIKEVVLGDRLFELKTKQYNSKKTEVKYFCNDCLRSYDEKIGFNRHLKKCDKKVPGRHLIYKEKDICVYKILGYDNVPYCQNLCLLGKCFIDHKTLFWDIENYNFYVLFENCNLAGFFSEEIYNDNNNLSCVVVLPDFQKKGFGSLLIDLSYYFKKGTCEKPLSIDGEILYHKYWKYKVFKYLQKNNYNKITIRNISDNLNMTIDDVLFTLDLLNCKLDDKITCIGQDEINIRLIKNEYLL